MEFLITFLRLFLQILSFAIIGRSIISWFDPAGRTPIARILIDVTEPIVRPVRRFMPQTGMIDFAPLATLLIIWLLQTLLANVAAGI